MRNLTAGDLVFPVAITAFVAGIVAKAAVGAAAVFLRRLSDRTVIEIYPACIDRTVTVPNDGKVYRVTIERLEGQPTYERKEQPQCR